MQLGQLAEAINKLRNEWTDDTEVYIDFDCPRCYSLDEVEGNDELDLVLLHTHPFSDEVDDEETDDGDGDGDGDGDRDSDNFAIA